MSKAKYTESTVAESVKPVEIVEASPAADAVVTPAETVVDNAAAQAAAPVQPDNAAAAVQPAAPAADAAAQQASDDTSNESSFTTGVEVKPTDTAQPADTKIDWKQVIKGIDPKDILAEMGMPVLDEHDLAFVKYRQSGGDPYQFIQNKFADFSKVSDQDAALSALKEQYPSLDGDKLMKLFQNRYKQDESAMEEDKEIGGIQMQADAYQWRQKKIAEQQSFKIPTIEPKAAAMPPEVQSQLDYVRNMVEHDTRVKAYVESNEVTKNFLSSKRVAVDLGDGKTFNFNIDNPQAVMAVMLNSDEAAKYGLNAKGEPDLQLALEMALFKMNPAKFKQDIVKFSMKMGEQRLIAEGQNAVKPTAKPIVEATKGFVVKGEGTVGGN